MIVLFVHFVYILAQRVLRVYKKLFIFQKNKGFILFVDIIYWKFKLFI